MTTSATSVIFLAIQIVTIGFAAYALVHAIRQREDAFTAAGKLTKPIWIGILAASMAFLFLFGPIGFFGVGIAAIAATAIYLVDVRPKVEEIQRPRW